MEVVEGQDLYKVSKRPRSLQRNTAPRPWWPPSTRWPPWASPRRTSGFLMLWGREHGAALEHSPVGPGTQILLWGRDPATTEWRGQERGDSTSPWTCASNKQKQKKRRVEDVKQNFGGLLGRVREFGHRVAVKSYWVIGMVENVLLS